MARKAQALAALAKIGAQLDLDALRYDNITIDVEGSVFGCNGEHSYHVGSYDPEDARLGFGPTMAQLWQELISAAAYGVEPCKISDCEACDAA